MAGGSVQFRILGSLEFDRDGISVDLGSFKQKSLLALMLVNPNQIVSSDRILDELWGETGAGKQNALWVHVSNLRSALEPERPARSEGTILLTRSPGYLLRVESGELDSTRFEALVSEGRGLLSSDPPAAALVFAEALALWRGRALEEFTYESFAQAEINRLESLRLDAVEGRIEADLARGLSNQLVGELQGLVREHPLRERFTALLMMALYRSQRQAEALRVYNQLRARLGSELGIDPSEPLRDLEEQILMGDPRLEPISTGRVVPGEPEPGLAVRGYELRSNLGKTRFGMVYRAYQPAIGREVAIKVIRPELANDPAFIRRFEADANVIAGLGSPNVVPLYDFWREPDAAFLVEKLVTGGDLGRLVGDGPLPLDRVMSIVEQVARPLRLAHELGVVHGGLRLENVLLDDVGNAHLTDFGIASEIDASVSGDIESLATLAAQLLAGSRGTISDLFPRIDPRVADVLRDAAGRMKFSTIDTFVDALRSATGHETGLRELRIEAANPYKGLEPFDESDTGHFFGRERLIERMLARLGGGDAVRRFLAVVGPSGSGKSSVVNAGLIPALRAGGVAGSDNWFIMTMTPGVHPFEGLERALNRVAVNYSPTLLEQMLAEPSGLRRSVDLILPDLTSPLVLVIDQFEELYTIAAADEREAFAAALVEAVTHARSRLRVVITLRADFYDHPLATPGLGELLRDHTELVTPMTAAELELAINRPAATAGVVVQPALLAALTADAVSDSAALPMLQYSLTEMFDRRRGGTLTIDAYQAMGGLTGAVVQRAESLFAALTPEARSAARHVFLRLVSVNDSGEYTRRRALLSELQMLEGRDGYLDDMLRAFARHRLLSFDRDPASRGPTVEIAHESLIGAWSRLSGWIDEARDDLRAQRRLAAAVAEWADQDKNPDFLLTGASLARYAAWQSDSPVRLTSNEQAFLTSATEMEDARDKADRERVLQESQLRRRTRALVGLAAMSMLVVLLAAFAFSERQTARHLAAQLSGLSLARQLASDSAGVIAEDPGLAILLAIEAIRATEPSGEALPEAVDALHWALQDVTTQFPSDDNAIPVAVRPNVTGPRGVFALPPAELVAIGRNAVDRGLTAADCERFFLLSECPDTNAAIPQDLGIAGGFDDYTSFAGSGASLSGTRVVVTGYFSEAEVATTLRAAGQSFGIEVVYRALSTIETPDQVAIGDDPGDIVVLSAPGEIAGVAAERTIVDIGRYLGEQYLQDSYGEYLSSLARVHGHSHGLFIKVDAKSFLWYNAEAFANAGYTEPSTWDELVTLSNQIVQDGRTPWCLAAFQDVVTGWPITDWLETIVLRSESPAFYDRWANHDIPFDSPEVVAALEKVGLLAHSPDYVFPNPAVIGSRPILEGLLLASYDDPLLDPRDDPRCWLVPGAPWITSFFGDAPMVAMPFPTIDPAFSSSMEGAGDVAIVLSDRPEVRAVIRAMASPVWGVQWAQADSTFFAPHKGFDLGAYVDPVDRVLANTLRGAIDAETYRFDASDQLPGPVTEVLHSALVTYVSDRNASAEETLASVEAAWSDYEANQGGG